jgi:hypothetical protein
MPKIHKRKYEKIDDAEIDLVTQCNDSHEFYERYREMFPNKKKGIDSISKIWKRRSEFVKKRQPVSQVEEGSGPLQNIEALMSEQNRIMAEISSVMKEQLKVSREILSYLPKQIQKHEEHPQKSEDVKSPEQKDFQKKPTLEKRNDIMIGS